MQTNLADFTFLLLPGSLFTNNDFRNGICNSEKEIDEIQIPLSVIPIEIFFSLWYCYIRTYKRK